MYLCLGYPSWTGEVLQADQLWKLYEGLAANGLTSYSHVLTGYVNNLSSLETIMTIVKDLKRKNPNLLYCALMAIRVKSFPPL